MNDPIYDFNSMKPNKFKQLERIKGRLNFVGNPNVTLSSNDYHINPIHFAASNFYDNPVPVKTLVKAGADVNARCSDGNTPLNFSAAHWRKKITDVLLELGAEVNVQDHNGYTPLHHAVTARFLTASRYYLPVVKTLLRNGAHVNSLTRNLETPLTLSLNFGDLDLIKMLLEWGANVHIRSNEYETCLHKAVSFPDYNIIIELLKWGACTECVDIHGRTALELLLQQPRHQNVECAKVLLKASVLQSKGQRSEFSLHGEYSTLSEFIKECVGEVFRMISIPIGPNYSLCDFALVGVSGSSPINVPEKRIFDRVLQILKKETFSIYNYFIVYHFKRSYLIEKVNHLEICAKLETGNLFLNYDTICHICSYLSDEDSLKLFLA